MAAGGASNVNRDSRMAAEWALTLVPGHNVDCVVGEGHYLLLCARYIERHRSKAIEVLGCCKTQGEDDEALKKRCARTAKWHSDSIWQFPSGNSACERNGMS